MALDNEQFLGSTMADNGTLWHHSRGPQATSIVLAMVNPKEESGDIG